MADGLRAPLLPRPASAATASSDDGPPPHLTLTASHVAIDPRAAEETLEAVAAARAEHRRELKGLALNALSTVFGTGMSLCAKISGSQGIGVFEIVLTRSIILVLFTGPPLLVSRVNPFRDKSRRWLLVLRGVLGFLSVSSLYLAVSLLPLADASVLSFLSPIFVAALSPIILHEKTSSSTLLGIPIAMVGVVLVAQPALLFGGQDGISILGVGVGIMQAMFNSLARMAVRALSMGSNEPMASIIFGQGAISCVGAAIMCGATRRFVIPTQAPVWAALLIGGFLGYLYQLALTGGLQRARAAPAVAMSYLSVIWGILADVFIFYDLPDALSLVGAALICTSSLFVAFSQRKQAAALKAAAREAQEVVTAASRASLAASRGSLTAESAAAEPSAPATLGEVAADGEPHHQGSAALRDNPLLRGGSGEVRAGSAALREPLLEGSEEHWSGGSGGSSSGSGSTSDDWASAEEASRHGSLATAASWRTADEDGPLLGAPSLKAEVKEAVAAAAAAARDELPAPTTPAAPPPLAPLSGSAASLGALSGASPSGGSPDGGSPGAPEPGGGAGSG